MFALFNVDFEAGTARFATNVGGPLTGEAVIDIVGGVVTALTETGVVLVVPSTEVMDGLITGRFVATPV